MNRRSSLNLVLLYIGILLTATATAQQQPITDLQTLSSDFWTWRASEQPFSFDDIPRLDRPPGWAADWSASTVARRRDELTALRRSLEKIRSNCPGQVARRNG
jgi:hypothetical protein